MGRQRIAFIKMGPANHWSRFLWIFAGVVGLPLLAALVLSLTVDPFALFHPPPSATQRLDRPAVDTRIRMYKAYALRRQHPSGVLLGTSRVEMGIEPSHPGWGNGYNLALPGANIHELYTYLQHAWMTGRIRRAVLGIDMSSFSVHSADREDYLEGRLALPEHGLYSSGIARDLLAATVSIDALGASLRTVLETSPRAWIRGDGFRIWNEPAYQNDIAKRGGVVGEMRRREDSDSAVYRRFKTRDAAGDHDTLDTFRAMVRFAVGHQIDLRVFISPSHVRQWELVDATGAWGAFEALKVDLVNIMEAESRRGDLGPPSIWDFSGYNSVTSEPVPAEGTRSEMRWYWESSHYKPQVGFWVLCRVLRVEGAGCQETPPGFGRRLTGTNVGEALSAIREERAAFRAGNPALVEEMRKRFAPVGNGAGTTQPAIP